MRKTRFDASTAGDLRGTSLHGKLIAVSLILALMLASVPLASVFAAPPLQQGTGTGNGQQGNGTGNANLEQEWGNKRNQLAAEVAVFNNIQSRLGQSGASGNQGQYLDKYRAALAAAQTLVVNQGGFDFNGRVTNENRANQAIRQLAQYLSTIRGLKEKMASGSNAGNNNGGNNAGNNNGVGIPVTGGSASNNNNQNSAQNNNQSNSRARIWGNQFRQLSAAQTWFNNFQIKPGQNRNSEQISRYLDQYAFALRQANTVILNGSPNSSGQGGQGEGQGLNQSWGTGRQQLSMYLSMMRGLREKIEQGGNDNRNNNNNNNNNAGNNNGGG